MVIIVMLIKPVIMIVIMIPITMTTMKIRVTIVIYGKEPKHLCMIWEAKNLQ
jgi:hypothetical protein